MTLHWFIDSWYNNINSNHFHKGEYCFRGCSLSIKCWQPSTSWRLCQRFFYFYQTLTIFNWLTFMSEVVLFLFNIENLQQLDVYVRGCSLSINYWQSSTTRRLCQRLFYFYQILTTFNKLTFMSEVALFIFNIENLQQLDVYARGSSISIKYWQPSSSWRFCQRLFCF